MQDYVAEATSTIVNVQEITTKNALIINKKMQENLNVLKAKLEEMLLSIQQKYQHNETLLLRGVTNRGDSGRRRKRSFFICGAPFFKNTSCYTHPYNADYSYRSKVLHEFFPIDKTITPNMWTVKDKYYLIHGVKDQALAFVNAKARTAIRSLKDDTKNAKFAKQAITDETKALVKKPLAALLTMLKDSSFKLDWFTISTKDLNARHLPNECMALWEGFLNPTISRKPWLPEEEERLSDVAGGFNNQNWDAIAKHMTSRSGFQCLVAFRTLSSQSAHVKYVRWTKEEDEFLLQTVEQNRIQNLIQWTGVLQKIPTRTKNQLYQRYFLSFLSVFFFSNITYHLNLRYMFSLRPEIKKDKFTVEEDCIIMAGIKEFGKHFNKFPPNLLPGRSTLQIRNRYNNVLKFVGKTTTWTLAHDEILMDQVKKHGTSSWAEVAKLLPHTRTSCRSRYTTVSKYLQSNTGSLLKDVPRRKLIPFTNVTEDNWMETIISIKSTEKPSPSSMKSKITNDFFEYFKYSYDLKFEPLRDPEDRVTGSTHMVCQLMRSRICPSDFRMLHSYDAEQANLNYLNFNGPTPDFEMPTSWCTALLLRGLSVMYPCERSIMLKLENHDALTLFKQRFRKLIYNAAVEAHLRRTSCSNEMVVCERKAPNNADNIDASDILEINDRSEGRGTAIESYDLIQISDFEEDGGALPNYTVQTDGGTFVITLTQNETTEHLEQLIEPATKRKRHR